MQENEETRGTKYLLLVNLLNDDLLTMAWVKPQIEQSTAALRHILNSAGTQQCKHCTLANSLKCRS
jgi:hypothetical protein